MSRPIDVEVGVERLKMAGAVADVEDSVSAGAEIGT